MFELPIEVRKRAEELLEVVCIMLSCFRVVLNAINLRTLIMRVYAIDEEVPRMRLSPECLSLSTLSCSHPRKTQHTNMTEYTES